MRISDWSSDVCSSDLAKITALYLPAFFQCFDDRHGRFGRNSEANADIAPGRRKDLRIDADNISIQIEHRPARIALIDGGIGLNVAVLGPPLTRVAIKPGDETGSAPCGEEVWQK